MAVSLRFLSPGYVIGDKYSIVQAIGCGGMGIVYEATHTRLRQRVAVKMLAPDLVQCQDAVLRFEREARAAANLKSPHVVRIFDVDALSDGTPYIVMEFLEGRDLADELTARGPLPVAEAVDYLLEACDAMAEAHRIGIVHRDLKPSNLFLANDGRNAVLKVLDFGISKVEHDIAPSITTTRSGLGTAVYMSPEQVRSAKHVDARSDVWALGVVLYEMLAGCQPFSGDTTSAVAAAIVVDQPVPLDTIRRDVPRVLEQVLLTALEKDRDRRFADAAAFAAAIAPFGSRPPARSLTPGLAWSPPRSSSGGLLVERAARSSPARESPRARRSKRSLPRSLWIAGGLAIGLVSSAAVYREVGRGSVASSSASTLVVASSMAIAPAPRGSGANGSASPAEIEPPLPSGSPDAIVRQLLASSDSSHPTTSGRPSHSAPSRVGARSEAPSTPGPTARTPAATESAAPLPSPRDATKKKSTDGLPPDPG